VQVNIIHPATKGGVKRSCCLSVCPTLYSSKTARFTELYDYCRQSAWPYDN